MTDDSQASDGERYRAMEKKALDAFNTWHRFHEDLLKLGDFSAWLGERDNQIDLVTFFALDKDNLDSYEKGLKSQVDFLEGMRQMIQSTRTMLDEYLEAEAES